MNYEEARVKLKNTSLNNLKFAAKTNTSTTLRITNKKFQGEDLLHKVFLTTRTKFQNKKYFFEQYVDRYKTW